MSSGHKVFLALFALVIGVLVVYYGVILPQAESQSSVSTTTLSTESDDAMSEDAAVDTHAAATLPVTSAQPTTTARDSATQARPNLDSSAPADPIHLADSRGADGLQGGLQTDWQVPDSRTDSRDASSAGSPIDPLSLLRLSSALDSGSSGSEPVVTADDGMAADDQVRPLIAASPATSLPSSSPQPPPAQPTPAATAPVPTTQRTPPVATVEYTVKHGDTMSSIAAEWFGDASKWDLIAKENPLVDPARMQVGQKLRLPPKDAQRSRGQSSTDNGRTVYTVRSGDSLSKIAREVYGDSSKWQLIYDANRSVIGRDPADLKVGMKLVLPDVPPPPPPAR